MAMCITWQRQQQARKGEDTPPPTDPLKCKHCDFVGKNPHSLMIHTTKKHG